MTTEQNDKGLSKRFKFDNGSDMNSFWIYNKTLNPKEKYICCRIAIAGGPFGWNRRSINAAHIKMSDIEDLIKSGIVKKTSLYQAAKELIENPMACERKRELDNQGGFLNLTKRIDKIFYFQFDSAIEILKVDKSLNQEGRYRIASWDLYNYLNLLF